MPIFGQEYIDMSMTTRLIRLWRRIAIGLLSLCLLLSFRPSPQANELVNLTLHDEVYIFLKRLVAKNLLTKKLYNTQPLARGEVAEALIEITEKQQSGQIKLTHIEKNHLESFQWLFANEIDALKPGFLLQTDNPHAVTLSGEDYKIDLDFKAKDEVSLAKPSSENNQNTSITSADLILRAKLGQHLGISAIADGRLLVGSGSYNPYLNEQNYLFPRGDPRFRAIASMESYIVVDLSWLSAQWGMENVWWGPGWRGALMISDNSDPTDTLKISGIYGPIRFTYLTSILEGRSKKYMSAHRLEFIPHQGISIGMNEVMVFVEQYNLRYLNPFLVFAGAQTDDVRSNNLMGLDLDITLLPSIELYAEIMLDDFQIDDGLEVLRRWSSKYGALVGGYWVDPLGLKDTDARMEYAFVNQYAYTNTREDYFTEYTHKGSVIGHWMGPDADNLWLEVKHWLTDDLRVSLAYERKRAGEGDVNKRFPYVLTGPDQTDFWEFLSGVAESTHSFSAGLSYISIGKWDMDTEYTYSEIRNVDHKSGVDGTKHQLLVKVERRF